MFSGGLKAEIWAYGYNFYMFSGGKKAEIWAYGYNFYMFTRGKTLRYGPAATTSTVHVHGRIKNMRYEPAATAFYMFPDGKKS